MTYTYGNRDERKVEEAGAEKGDLYTTAVLDEKYVKESELIEVFVDEIVHRKQISFVVRDLNAAFPIPHLRHLKRVNGQRVILMLAEEGATEEQCKLKLKEKAPRAFTDLEGKPRKVAVSLYPPLTRKQFDRASENWPCMFHENKMIEALLSRQFFSSYQLEMIYHLMRAAVDVASENKSPVGAIVVKADTKSIMATGFDQRSKHPVKHAIIVLVDNLARKQQLLFTQTDSRVSSAAETDSLVPSAADAKRELPYLMTGCDVFVTREPCIMCAMALTHSRVRRVFYAVPSPRGAFATSCKLHTLSPLNHRYLVFSDVLPEDGQQLLLNYGKHLGVAHSSSLCSPPLTFIPSVSCKS